MAKAAKPKIVYIIGIPKMVSKARPPKYRTDDKFTKIYKQIQNTARMVFNVLLKRFSTNSGMV